VPPLLYIFVIFYCVISVIKLRQDNSPDKARGDEFRGYTRVFCHLRPLQASVVALAQKYFVAKEKQETDARRATQALVARQPLSPCFFLPGEVQ
jgi:hypothetical protein